MSNTIMGLLAMVGCAALFTIPARARETDPSISLPDTPAGRRFVEWRHALNDGDAADLRRFYEKAADPSLLQIAPASELAGRDYLVLGRAGGLALTSVQNPSPGAVTIQATTRITEEPFQVTLEVAEAPPHGVKAIHVRPLPTEPPARRPSDAEIGKDLDSYLRRLEKAGLFSGVVLVAHNGKPVFRKAYGLASRAWNVPNRPDTKFNLGSMNKMMTAVAIAQLIQRGKLSLTDTVGKVLPEYPNKEAAGTVTVQHLLTHTSGLADYFTDDFWNASRTRFRTVDDYLPLFQEKPLEFTPGTKFRYSNAGFMLLGKIVQAVSGQDYFEYVREHIYQPAGMGNTDAYELDRETPNLAIGYTELGPDGPHPGDLRNNTFLHVIRGGPAGGGYSTVDDLLAFAEALRAHKLLDAKHTEMLFENHVRPEQGDPYGFGFEVETVHGQRLVGHGGGFPGINTKLDIYRDSGDTVVVLSNTDTGAQPVIHKTRTMLGRN